MMIYHKGAALNEATRELKTDILVNVLTC